MALSQIQAADRCFPSKAISIREQAPGRVLSFASRHTAANMSKPYVPVVERVRQILGGGGNQ